MIKRYEEDVFCDQNDKLELFINNNIFVNIGFNSFLNRCMKGFDRVVVKHETGLTLKEYINKLFPIKSLDIIITRIKNKKISQEDYFHIESMLNTYMIEHKIKKIREECKLSYLLSNNTQVFYNDHGHFMRMIIAMSFIKRFTVNQILEMAHIFFDYVHANISHTNNFVKKYNLKCHFGTFRSFIEYHPNLEFFFYQNTINDNVSLMTNLNPVNLKQETKNTEVMKIEMDTTKVKPIPLRELEILLNIKKPINQEPIQIISHKEIENNHLNSLKLIEPEPIKYQDILEDTEIKILTSSEDNDFLEDKDDNVLIDDELINDFIKSLNDNENSKINKDFQKMSVKCNLNDHFLSESFMKIGRVSPTCKSPVCFGKDLKSRIETIRSRSNRVGLE